MKSEPKTMCEYCTTVKEKFARDWKHLDEQTFQTGRKPVRAERRTRWLCPQCVDRWQADIVARHNATLKQLAHT